MSEFLEPGFFEMVETIADHGWMGLHIAEDHEGPGFSYSIGFWESAGAPEMIIFGLPNTDLCHSMLWELYDQLRAGLTPSDGARISNLIEDFDCILRPVHPSHHGDYFGRGLLYHRFRGRDDAAFRAWQVFWPGRNQGLFPWEKDCVDDVVVNQPLLYLPRERGIA